MADPVDPIDPPADGARAPSDPDGDASPVVHVGGHRWPPETLCGKKADGRADLVFEDLPGRPATCPFCTSARARASRGSGGFRGPHLRTRQRW
jgi:hypothetical protein